MKPQNVLVLIVLHYFFFQSFSWKLWENIQDLSSFTEVYEEDIEKKADF